MGALNGRVRVRAGTGSGSGRVPEQGLFRSMVLDHIWSSTRSTLGSGVNTSK